MSLKVTKIKISDSLTHKAFDCNISKLDVHYEVGLSNALVNSGRSVMVNLKNYVTKDSLYDKFDSQTLLDIDCKFNQGRFLLKKCAILRYKTELDSGILIEDIDMIAVDIEVLNLKKGMPPIVPFIFR